MFSSKYVKVPKIDFDIMEIEHNELLEKVALLEAANAELEKNQSQLLMGLVKKQSAEIVKLMKYKEQDDTLYSYEQTNEKHLETIREQSAKIVELESENETILFAYQKESNMSSLLAKKIVNGKYDCETYKTVNKFEVRA